MSEHKQDPHAAHGAKPGAEGAAAHGAAGHGADAHGADAHGGHGNKKHDHDHPPGTPPWLISFGDMMTLFLCFFIMLVTMAPKQDAGLVAAGLGPFVAALESKGNDAALTGAETLAKVNTYRARFGLAAISEDQLIGAAEVDGARDIEALVKQSLRPYSEMMQPLVAQFDAGSDQLGEPGRRYLDLLADTLRPGFRQILVLEGHADDANANNQWNGDDTRLAFRRAAAVKEHLVTEHGFIPNRVEARAWAMQVPSVKTSSRGVDARLVQPQVDVTP